MTAAFLLDRYTNEWKQFTDMSHWSKRHAHVVRTEVTRDYSDKHSMKVIVHMKVDGQNFEDSFLSLRAAKADSIQRDLRKAGKVLVYKNNLAKNEEFVRKEYESSAEK